MLDGEKIPVKTVDLFLYYITSGDSHSFNYGGEQLRLFELT